MKQLLKDLKINFCEFEAQNSFHRFIIIENNIDAQALRIIFNDAEILGFKISLVDSYLMLIKKIKQ